MTDLLASILPAEYVSIGVWVVWGLITLIALLIVWKLIRIARRPRQASGRRSKAARLAVTDAAAIDPHRRLVLVRRDDVEHLIMIGGPSDLVIEQEIRRHAPARPTQPVETTSASTSAQVRQTPPPAPTPSPAPHQTAPKSTPAPTVATPAAPTPTVSTPTVSTPTVAALGAAAGAVAATGAVSIDNALEATKATSEDAADRARELIATKNDETPEQPAPAPEPAVEKEPSSVADDINSLLDDISRPKDS